MKRLLIALVAVSASGTAMAQSFNVDFGSLGYGAGVPQNTYGAASSSVGEWNGVDSDMMATAGTTFNTGPLMDLGGNMSGVSMDCDSMGLGFIPYEFNEPNTGGDDEALLDDIFYVAGLHTITVNGLSPGDYRVYVYAMAPDSATAFTSVNVQGSPDPLAIVGGSFAGGFVRDVTHSEHAVTVIAGGAIVIEIDVNAQFDSVNGVQIVQVSGGGLGTSYCTAVPNSTGAPGEIHAMGSPLVSDNDVTLEGKALPMNSFGFFLTSQTQGFVPNPGGSSGNLCVSGSIGRYVGSGQIQNSGMSGTVTLVLDLAQTPTPGGLVQVQPGETWFFTLWFRDVDPMGNATSNFTNGREIGFN